MILTYDIYVKALNNKKLTPEEIKIIATDDFYSVLYAKEVRFGRFEEAEEIFAKKQSLAMFYLKECIATYQPNQLATVFEKLISINPLLGINYNELLLVKAKKTFKRLEDHEEFLLLKEEPYRTEYIHEVIELYSKMSLLEVIAKAQTIDPNYQIEIKTENLNIKSLFESKAKVFIRFKNGTILIDGKDQNVTLATLKLLSSGYIKSQLYDFSKKDTKTKWEICLENKIKSKKTGRLTPDVELELAKSGTLSQRYAHFVLKGRFEQGEAAIAKDKWATIYYILHTITEYCPSQLYAVIRDLQKINPDFIPHLKSEQINLETLFDYPIKFTLSVTSEKDCLINTFKKNKALQNLSYSESPYIQKQMWVNQDINISP